MHSKTQVEQHYHRTGLFEEILDRLRAAGTDLRRVTRADLAGVDEFHVRGAEVSRELAGRIELRGRKVLDVGCGIGGPCRMLADEFTCEVTGVDISHEFIRTAKKLSGLAGLGNRIEFIQADAMDLPFENASFDVVWTQHVQMNVRDKAQFYGEICRVLKSGGTFIYYDIFKTGNADIAYPTPWADGPAISFLAQPAEVGLLLEQQGLQKVQTTDETEAGILFFERLLERARTSAPPALGLSMLMGEAATLKSRNVLAGLKAGNIVLQSGVYRKEIGGQATFLSPIKISPA